MISNDTIDDRKAKTSPFFACRHIWFEEAVPDVLRKTRAIIFNSDLDASFVFMQDDTDVSIHIGVFRHSFNRLSCVFQQVSKGLPKEPLVTPIDCVVCI